MKNDRLRNLSRRERQIMDVIYQLGQATVADVRDNIPDPPTENALRRLISILEEKGMVRHAWDGPRHIYSPIIGKRQASRSALDHLKQTFFDGSTARAMVALFDQAGTDLSPEDLALLEERIAAAKRQNR